MSTLYPGGPPDDDITDIEAFFNNLGITPETSWQIGSDDLEATAGWRDVTFTNIGDAFNYMLDGGIESLSTLLWDDGESVWRVYVYGS